MAEGEWKLADVEVVVVPVMIEWEMVCYEAD